MKLLAKKQQIKLKIITCVFKGIIYEVLPESAQQHEHIWASNCVTYGAVWRWVVRFTQPSNLSLSSFSHCHWIWGRLVLQSSVWYQTQSHNAYPATLVPWMISTSCWESYILQITALLLVWNTFLFCINSKLNFTLYFRAACGSTHPMASSAREKLDSISLIFLWEL